MAAGSGGALVGSARQHVPTGALETHATVVSTSTGGPSGSTDLTLFPRPSPLSGLGMPPATAPFSAAASLHCRRH
jgi:hypothetical protein